MDEEQKRRSLLVTEYYDGAARALDFLDAHQLLVRCPALGSAAA
ncbi:MAG: hypothetical protein Q8L48_31355 [Archangium sp.]|nr:hypothetical protein [Archangium sp.]